MMVDDARRAGADDDDDIFVYMGSNQRVPDDVRRARIHKSVKIVQARAFKDRRQLIYVEFHDGIEIIEEEAFSGCPLRGGIKLLGVKIIKEWAFRDCNDLTDVEFGDKLETIEFGAFIFCYSLKNIKLPSVRTIGFRAFAGCDELFDVEFGEALRTLEGEAFSSCFKLKRIALPLKDYMIEDNVFLFCPKLTTVDLVGGIHKTVASLHDESWRNEMNNEINRINQTLPTVEQDQSLPTIESIKTAVIQQWMESVIDRLDHYKAEHKALLKEATTLLELALWKTKLGDNVKDEKVAMEMERLTARKKNCVTSCARKVIKNVLRVVEVRTRRGGRERARKELSVTSGADVVIKNVLPFLKLE